jgi:ATP-dependent exoDNAse (exonuclease V) alpha subunit
VTSIDQDKNRLTVEMRSGASIRYDPRRLQGISAYQEITRSFSPGDRIQFTAPNKELDVANRAMATIVGIEGRQVTARLDGDQAREVTFDSREMRHFDHGYAVTSHSSQGVTAERVLVNMDTRANPELINTRFAYVAVSRASQDAQIFTNDAEALGQRLSRDVTKSSAIDFRQVHRADQAFLERAATPANTQKMDTSIGFGL